MKIRFLHVFRFVCALFLSAGFFCTEALADDPEGPGPIFTFVFDDGSDTDYLIGKEIFERNGTVACTAISADLLNTPRHLTTAQALALRDAGWEILSHTATHPNLSNLDRMHIENELIQSKQALEALGMNVKNIVYPYNKNNETVRDVTSALYRSGRGGRSMTNRSSLERYELKSYSFKSNLNKMHYILDKAYEERGWIILYHHQFDAKVIVNGMTGTFQHDEEISFQPSGARGRFDNSLLWVPFYGQAVYFTPLSGVPPMPGDMIVGLKSGAVSTVDRMVYNDREDIESLLMYIQSNYPDMRIVTIDQGLDLYDAYELQNVGSIR